MQAYGLRRAKYDHSQMGKKMYIERCVIGVSLAREAELKKILVGYLVKTSIKGGRR